MYLNRNCPGVVDGHRISYGEITRDEAKRIRLAGPTSKAISLVESPVEALHSGEKKWKHSPFLKKWGLAKYHDSFNMKSGKNGGGRKLKKDSLKSISTDDGFDVGMKKRKSSYNNNNNNDDDKIASFKRNMAQKEVALKQEAKRQKIASALSKQNITVEYTDLYTCSEVQCSVTGVGGLKLRLTKVSSVVDTKSSCKRKRER